MKLIFLGTSSLMSEKTINTSVLINDNILVDIGSGTLVQLQKYNKKVSDIKYIIISHYHSDHFLDIADFILKRAIRGYINNKLVIIGPEGIKTKVIELLRFTNGDRNDITKFHDISEKNNIEFIEMNGNEYADNFINIRSLPMIHGQTTPCNGYIIDIDNIKLGYTGDTTMCANLNEMCNEVNNLIIDASELETSMKHIGLVDIKKLSDNYPNCTFYAVHRSDYDFKDYADKIKFPDDGEEINI
jgi:ribonuclease BN (tRNA processing enzyme)